MKYNEWTVKLIYLNTETGNNGYYITKNKKEYEKAQRFFSESNKYILLDELDLYYEE